ncbi:unnamed protein product [Cuscuta europaea]|nr:unnamed protein product [Cuscuta europaea]
MKSGLGLESEEDQKGTTLVPLGPPHEAMFLVLAYLPLFELLCMTQVCRSLAEAVNCDVLPWRIVVKKPLDRRLTDEIMLKIAAAEDGRLTTLALFNCFKITDYGLLRVIAKNPNINKLYIPGCTLITPGGVIKAVQLLAKGSHRLKSIKLSGIYNMNKENLSILCNLLGQNQENQNMRNLYHKRRNHSRIGEDDDGDHQSIDIDVCSKCTETRMVFDCPLDSCSCRGCIICIKRCEECGVCVKDDEDRPEAACLDDLCLGCWMKLPKCSFCNRPYCHEHAEQQQCRVPGSEGFLCVACHDRFLRVV